MVLDYGMELKSELGEKGAQPGFCPLVNGTVLVLQRWGYCVY